MEGTTGKDAGAGGDPPEAPTRGAAGKMAVWRRLAPAIGLALLAPLIGEYLLGNVSITAIFALFILAPLYGCGALLIREGARHAGRGWPTMIVLGIAYALFEEGLVTQFLFNPSYHDLDLQSAAYVPALGIGVRLTVTIIALHAIWSTCVPIALVEALVPARSDTPWLGKVGLAITGVVFLLGSAYLFYGEYTGQGFLASPPQLVGTAPGNFGADRRRLLDRTASAPSHRGTGSQSLDRRGGRPGDVQFAPVRRGCPRLVRSRHRARLARDRRRPGLVLVRPRRMGGGPPAGPGRRRAADLRLGGLRDGAARRRAGYARPDRERGLRDGRRGVVGGGHPHRAPRQRADMSTAG